MSQSDALTCREIVEHITDYLDAALAPDILPPYEAHLSVCAECVAFLHQTRTTVTLTRSLADHPLTPAARERLLHLFRDWTSGELT